MSMGTTTGWINIAIDIYCEDEALLDDGSEMQMQLCYNHISKEIVSSNPIDAGDK